jgi:hypothetical protein
MSVEDGQIGALRPALRSRNRSISRKLTDAVIEEARTHKFQLLSTRIAGERAVRLLLRRNVGVSGVGVMKEVGRKFGRLNDIHILQKMLDRTPQTSYSSFLEQLRTDDRSDACSKTNQG